MNELFYVPLVEAKQAELRAAAARSRLARIATCCRPSQWRRTTAKLAVGVREWFRRGQLGPVGDGCTSC